MTSGLSGKPEHTREIRLHGNRCGRVLQIDEGRLSTTAIGVDGESLVVTRSEEVALIMDASRWRHDIDGWRFIRGEGETQDAKWHSPDCDDRNWMVVTHLHPLYHTSFPGRACFRHRFALPEEFAGEDVTFVIGGFDIEDWLSYRLSVNGEFAEEWVPRRGWHEPNQLRLERHDDRYSALRFGADNLLVVEVAGLERPRDRIVPGEDEHHLFQSWLLDQFVVVGTPYETVRDFAVLGVEDKRRESVRVMLESDTHPGLKVDLEYDVSDVVLRKRVTVRNGTANLLPLLDVFAEDLEISGESLSRGGNGQPVIGNRVFAGLEFPVAMNQGEHSRLRLVQMPGAEIQPNDSFVAESSVLGVVPEHGDTKAAFRQYVETLRPRSERRLSIYSPLGWYDFTNPADPLFELNEELVNDNLDQLDILADSGALFDVYMFDDWWEPTDPLSFRHSTFPQGGAAIAKRVREHNMAVGLWVAPALSHWSWGKAPGMEAALTGGLDPAAMKAATGGGAGAQTERVDPETGEWDWDEIFGLGQVSAPRLCPAAEPLRSALRDSLAHHARELKLSCLKIDFVCLHCTSSAHGHRAGRHSFEAGTKALLAAVAEAERASPGLFVIWYWSARSPWWLKYGDLLFDKGIKLEAASPATLPAYLPRQAVSLNTDQAVHHAELIPLDLQDSLGIWLGNVAWANRIGKAGWRDAFILDVARGSTVMQLWGDITLLDGDDRRFLASALAWGAGTEGRYRKTTQIGGDPWKGEIYGYAWETSAGTSLVLHNPSVFEREFIYDVGEQKSTPLEVLEIFPFPGLVEVDPDRDQLRFDLRPYEVRALELQQTVSDATPQRREPIAQTRQLDVNIIDAPRTGISRVYRGEVRLPAVHRGESIMLTVRLRLGDNWWYHPAPHQDIRLAATLRGSEVWYDAQPSARSYNGPGYPWLVYRIPAGTTWSDETLRIRLDANLPERANVRIEAVLLDPWWDRQSGQMAPLRERPPLSS